MKLVSYPTSPFARKVRIAAIEVGVDDRLEIVDANPLADDGVVARHNPLGKVPALVLDDRTLVDSPLICAYLDLSDTVTIGTITVGCALGYLDRRYAEVNWRDREPDLAEWFEVWSARPAAVATAPPPGHPGATETLRSGGDALR